MHIPSFFAGSVVSGGSFLLINRQMSHRQRLATKWILAEQAEKELNEIWANAKATMSSTSKPQVEPSVDKYMDDATKTWNAGVDQVRAFVSKKD